MVLIYVAAWKASSSLPEVFLIRMNYARKIDTFFARTMKTRAYRVYCMFKKCVQKQVWC